MEHELLKRIIYDRHAVIAQAKIVPRKGYVFDPNANYILTGMRRAGKSTLLYKRVQDMTANGIAWERIIYINFEDERLAEFRAGDFDDILSVQSELSEEKAFYFFDEIQNVPGWEKFARRMADSGERVYITGSNAKMLSGEIASTLGGRYLEKRVTPYSFEEYLDAGGIGHADADLNATKPRGRIAAALREYLHSGGLPETLKYTVKREYISSVYEKVLLGDIVSRKGIRNPYTVRLLMKKIAESVMNEVSYTRLHGALKAVGVSAGKDTVIDYIEYAKEAYLLFSINNLYYKFSDKESTPKYYFSDTGLLNLFLTDKDNALLENAVAIRLKQLYGDEVFYMHSALNGIDVDFCVPDEGLAVQVCLTLNDESFEREVAGLVRAAKAGTDIGRCLIVTLNERKTIVRDDIRIEAVPADLFLLKGVEAM